MGVPPRILLLSLCNILSNIAAMHQDITVEAAEIGHVMQREKKMVLGVLR